MPDMQESASHHVNDLATPGFTAKLKDHIRQDVQIDEKTQDEIHNCVLNDKLKPYRPNVGTGGKPSTWFPPGDS